MKNNKLLLSGTIIAILSSSVLLAGKGGTPNGKPFVELAGQIVEVEGEVSTLQDQMAELIGRVDSIEDNVTANTAAIADLEAMDIALKVLIDTNRGDIVLMKGQLSDLERETAQLRVDMASGDSTLKVQIDINDGLITALKFAVSDMGSLQKQIDALVRANEELQIAIDDGDGTLHGYIDTNLRLIAGLEDDISGLNGLQEQINNNVEIIELLRGEVVELEGAISMKQNVINGFCPDGSAIREVLAGGSVRCQEAGDVDDASAELDTYTTYDWVRVGPYASGDVQANCGDGYKALSGGYSAYGFDIYLKDTQPTSGGYHRVGAYSTRSFTNYLYSTVVCGKIAVPDPI